MGKRHPFRDAAASFQGATGGLQPLKCRLFHRIALECGQWDRQRLPLQCSMFRIGTGCGRAEARPYHKKPTSESGLQLGLQPADHLAHRKAGAPQVAI
jgi:hypothetical protein